MKKTYANPEVNFLFLSVNDETNISLFGDDYTGWDDNEISAGTIKGLFE